MKIVQIITQMEAGGAQRVAYLLHEALRARGHDARLWFLYRKRGAYDGVAGIDTLFPEHPQNIDYLRITARLVAHLRQERPDAVITHTHYANILGNLAAQVCGVPKRVAVHHSPIQAYPTVARTSERILTLLGAATSAVAVSDAVVESFRSYSNSTRKLTRIYNGIPDYGTATCRVKSREEWGLPNDRPLIVNVGRLAKEKNQSAIIEALSYLPDHQAAIVGGGELKEELLGRCEALQVRDRVHFLGEVSHENVIALLRMCDVFLFPSLYEAMPMALVEAMKARAVIVASDIPANREVLGDGGVIVESQPKLIADAIRNLQGLPDRLDRLRSSAQRRAEQFSVEAMVRGYEQLLQA